MKTERNEFQQLVNHQMGNIEWDWKKSHAVLRKLHQQEPAPRRHVLRYAVTFTMTAVAIAVLAVSILQRQPAPDMVVATQPPQTIAPIPVQQDSRAEAVYIARQAVMEKYGLTLQTLGVFLDDCQLTETGWVVRFFTTGLINRRLAGEYTVEKNNGFISTSWTHDNVDKSVYADGSLNRVAWSHQQILYARTEGHAEAMTINQELNAIEGTSIDYDHIEGTDLWGDALHDTSATEGDIAADVALAAVPDALSRQFGLTAEALALAIGDPLLPEHGSLRQSDSGIRVWVFHPSLTIDGVNYYTAVFLNAQTGELERLEYTTLGFG